MTDRFWIRHGTLLETEPPAWEGGFTVQGPLFQPEEMPAGGGEGMPPQTDSFWNDLLQLNRRLGATKKALSLLKDVSRGKADVLITGQQPGILGGPLYNFLKLATTVVTARRWSEHSGRPVLPLFWGVTDDTDFGEISWTLLPDRQLRLNKIRIEPEPESQQNMVGCFPRESWQEGFDQALGLIGVEGDLNREPVWLKSLAGLPGDDWGEAFLALLLHLTGPHPLIVVDGRRPSLLSPARPLFEKYLEHLPAAMDAIKSRGEELQKRQITPLLDSESALRPIYILKESKRIRRDGEAEGMWAPNVILRPLMQGYLFPQRGVVVGLGEILYRIQMRDLYKIMDLQPPALLPRFSATILPPWVQQLPKDIVPMEWLLDIEAARAKLERSPAGEKLGHLSGGFRKKLRAILAGMAEIGSEEDKSYPQLVASVERKIDFQIKRLEEGLRAKIRARRLRENPGLAHFEEFLRPKGRLQERGLSLLTAGLFCGPDIYSEILDWVEEWGNQWSGSEGKWSHWVMGPPKDKS
ncbi:MAG: bacillithiol biosynthesis BshC [Candidatus Eisenbacteria bacterium]|uniref:Bacillithiol biosynthesis BshC n=1 Tax=Eiseniibacteriota bacterium TaxID=2212470 RepID=A0A948RWG0_UNCEI|nr:bacillithiol biosynthesis BshC [Candidatus Eisenbacteria bacterium]MBU1947149.1 bacillithiol biosynthesis BshC [Candidatus Eisenbacteria bacterium]MBU2691231.1 bacillithiol biosynthesis BshC [Candidatus Eisenbacteria bacterium]